MKTSLGQFAYEAYGDAVEWTAHTGKPMPAWESLPSSVRAAWIYSAWSVYRETALVQVAAIAEAFGES